MERIILLIIGHTFATIGVAWLTQVAVMGAFNKPYPIAWVFGALTCTAAGGICHALAMDLSSIVTRRPRGEEGRDG